MWETSHVQTVDSWTKGIHTLRTARAVLDFEGWLSKMGGRLEGRVALITGAARGQGASHARHLAAEGADVVAVDICHDIPSLYPLGTRGELDAAVASVQELGRRALAIECDQRDDGAVAAAVALAEREFGRIDILVNNAGVLAVSGITDMSVQEMDIQIDVNLKGPFNFVRHVAPGMKERHFGRIINISSSGGVRPFAYLSHYVAAKAGLIMAGRSWAQEFGDYGITVNAIAPGVLRTPMNDHVLASLDMGLDEGYAEWMSRNVFRGEQNPLTVDDISRAIVYLASDDGRAVTGQTLGVDSGWTIT